MLAPAGVPLHRSHSDRFDELVLDAVEELEAHWPELAEVEVAVEDIPADPPQPADGADEVVDRGVVLGRSFAAGESGTTPALIVVYRRPVEGRGATVDERGDVVYTVLAELAGDLLGHDPEELG